MPRKSCSDRSDFATCHHGCDIIRADEYELSRHYKDVHAEPRQNPAARMSEEDAVRLVAAGRLTQNTLNKARGTREKLRALRLREEEAKRRKQALKKNAHSKRKKASTTSEATAIPPTADASTAGCSTFDPPTAFPPAVVPPTASKSKIFLRFKIPQQQEGASPQPSSLKVQPLNQTAPTATASSLSQVNATEPDISSLSIDNREVASPGQQNGTSSRSSSLQLPLHVTRSASPWALPKIGPTAPDVSALSINDNDIVMAGIEVDHSSETESHNNLAMDASADGMQIDEDTSSSSPEPTPPPRVYQPTLLGLPVETRNNIMKYLIVRENRYGYSHDFLLPEKFKCPLLGTCRILRKEVLDFLGKETTIVSLDLYTNHGGFLPMHNNIMQLPLLHVHPKLDENRPIGMRVTSLDLSVQIEPLDGYDPWAAYPDAPRDTKMTYSYRFVLELGTWRPLLWLLQLASVGHLHNLEKLSIMVSNREMTERQKYVADSVVDTLMTFRNVGTVEILGAAVWEESAIESLKETMQEKVDPRDLYDCLDYVDTLSRGAEMIFSQTDRFEDAYQEFSCIEAYLASCLPGIDEEAIGDYEDQLIDFYKDCIKLSKQKALFRILRHAYDNGRLAEVPPAITCHLYANWSLLLGANHSQKMRAEHHLTRALQALWKIECLRVSAGGTDNSCERHILAPGADQLFLAVHMNDALPKETKELLERINKVLKHPASSTTAPIVWVSQRTSLSPTDAPEFQIELSNPLNEQAWNRPSDREKIWMGEAEMVSDEKIGLPFESEDFETFEDENEGAMGDSLRGISARVLGMPHSRPDLEPLVTVNVDSGYIPSIIETCARMTNREERQLPVMLSDLLPGMSGESTGGSSDSADSQADVV